MTNKQQNVFTPNYSSFYDFVYQGKDYAGECDMLEQLFEQYLPTKPKTIIDFGCGTGNHSIRLAKRNYDVTGVDQSDSMLQIAKDNALNDGLNNEKNVSFRKGDMCLVNLNTEFDVGICMFAVLCYQLSNESLELALKTCARHIKRGGIFVFDFWYGPAVLSIKPETRIKEFFDAKNNKRIIRIVSPNLNSLSHTCTSEYTILELEAEKVTKEACEQHTTRYFFPLEIEYFLNKAGFKLAQLSAFPESFTKSSIKNLPPTENSWNALAVAIRE